MSTRYDELFNLSQQSEMNQCIQCLLRVFEMLPT